MNSAKFVQTCVCVSEYIYVQVNHSPSFTTDSQLDREVKDALLYDTLVLINLSACDRRKITKEERRKVKERLQQHRSREARYGEQIWCEVFPRSHTPHICSEG